MRRGISVLRNDLIEPFSEGGLHAAISHDEAQHPHPNDPWRSAQATGSLIVRATCGASGDTSPRWLPRFKGQWEARAAALAAEASKRSVQLILWPMASDVVSDVPSLLTFLRGGAGSGWKFLADPAGLFTPSMLASPADHLARIADALLAHSACAGVLLRDVEYAGDGSLRYAGLAAVGPLTPTLTAADGAWRTAERTVLLPENLSAQCRLLNPST